MAKAMRMVKGSAARAGRSPGNAATPAIFKALRRVIRGCNKASRIRVPSEWGWFGDF
jgi:hypothetical protein